MIFITLVSAQYAIAKIDGLKLTQHSQYGYFFVSILRAILKGGGAEYSFRELLYTIKSGRSVVGYYEHELWKEKQLYVNRPIKMSDEFAEIFRILKIEVLRYDVKLEPYPYNVE